MLYQFFTSILFLSCTWMHTSRFSWIYDVRGWSCKCRRNHHLFMLLVIGGLKVFLWIWTGLWNCDSWRLTSVRILMFRNLHTLSIYFVVLLLIEKKSELNVSDVVCILNLLYNQKHVNICLGLQGPISQSIWNKTLVRKCKTCSCRNHTRVSLFHIACCRWYLLVFPWFGSLPFWDY